MQKQFFLLKTFYECENNPMNYQKAKRKRRPLDEEDVFSMLLHEFEF